MKNWIRKKRFRITLAGLVAILIFILIGLGSCYTQFNNETAPPILAFASDRSGTGDIFVLDQAGQIRNITNHPQADWDPTWSPSGTQLAFTSHRSGNSDIWLMDLPDTAATPPQPRNLTNHPNWDYSPTWSPSGQSVAFVSERDGDPDIFVQNLAEESALQLTFNEEMERYPAWSPDGQHIAFATVRDGVEKIYRIRPDGTDEQLLTPAPLKGTAPAWGPDSKRLAFIGWDQENSPGIYIIGPEADDLEQVYQGQNWLGSLNWSTDGKWLTFTSWQNGNHELYALSIDGGSPVRMTINQAWDDFMTLHPTKPFAALSPNSIAQAAPAIKLPSRSDFAAGANLADLGMAYLVNDMGLDWSKGFVNWATVEPQPGEFNWIDPDNMVKAFSAQELKILMRIHGTPLWSHPDSDHLSHPPNDMADFATFVTALATRYKGQIAAYEIWNEPNLNYEWGNLSPDPVAYTDMLKTAYTAIKKVDPDALVISGGLATTGDGSDTAYGDLAFLQGMYEAGAKGHFDALGSHPYAYGQSPDTHHPDGLSFDRVAAQHELMTSHGDGDTPIWITEIGWVLESDWNLGEHQTIGVTQEQQAQYLSRAYTKTQEEWPFVEALFFFNLDFSTVPWYPTPEPMRWYAILNPDRTPRPAYTALRHTMRTR